MGKKGDFSQAFTYIAVLLILGAIAFVGAKAIIGLLEANCESKRTEFSNHLSKFIEAYTDKGTVKIESITTPCNAKQLCFADSELLGANFPDPDAIVTSSVQENAYNVFVKGEFTEPLLLTDKISVEGDLLCVTVIHDSVKIRFSGTGKTVKIEAG